MTELRPDWRPSALQRRLVTVAVAALLAAITFGRPQLVALATPAMWALVVGRVRPRPTTVRIRTEVDRNRCFEHEAISVDTTISLDDRADHITAHLEPSPDATIPIESAHRAIANSTALTARWAIHAERWGRHSLGTLTVRIHTAGGLLDAEARFHLPDAAVFPRPPKQVNVTPPRRLPDRIGEHVTRTPGHGVEFAGVSPYTPGDLPRRVNWPISLRRGDLYVNRFAAERSADLVVMVDAFDDVGPPGTSSLDLSVRGAAGIAQAYLRQHDRVGFVAVAGILHWLGPDVSARQFYRIAEHTMDARHFESVVTPDLQRLPHTALPPWAMVVFFSPLLDPRAHEVIRDLRQRGCPLAVVDVMASEPAAATPLALRLWRIDRLALRRELTELGVAVVRWDGSEPLDIPPWPLVSGGAVRGRL